MKALLFTLWLFLFFSTLPIQGFAEGTVTINEFLPRPSSGSKEWVEFYNPQNIDISSYYLDDDADFNSDTGSSSKKILSELNKDNSSFSYMETSSFLNNSGDFVVLFSPNGEIIDKYEYVEDPGIDVSVGRYPNGAGELTVLSSSTKGQLNNSPHVNTPTPIPTPISTSTPVPTKAVSAKSPSKISATSIPVQKIYPSISSREQVLVTAVSPKISIPTSVLGQSTKSATTAPDVDVNESGKELKVLGSTKNNIFKIMVVMGIVVFIISCAILLSQYFKNKKNINE